MNIELKDFPAKIMPALKTVRRYTVLIFVLVVTSVFGFLVMRIGSLTQTEPNDDLILERLQTLQRPRIDESTIEKINQLESQNIDVQSLFQQARDNPFSE
jgi:hypothetical protein